LGNRREKWEGDFKRKMMMFENMIESILMYGAEIWGWKEQKSGRESARKIFERGARSKQRNGRLHNEGRL
jgi:hypothetical protein